MLEYQNIKTFLLKHILQNSQRTFLQLKKLKVLFHRHINDLSVEGIIGAFYEKYCKRLIKTIYKREGD